MPAQGENGQLHFEAYNKNGKQEGIQKEYYESGQLLGEINFKNGAIEGISKEYYKNGHLKLEVSYKNGKMEGPYKTYFKSRQVEEEVNYKNGKMEGIGKRYFESGQAEEEVNHKNGKREGPYKKYHENGKLKEEGIFKNDKVEGTAKQYYETGKLKAEANFKNGIKVDRKTSTEGSDIFSSHIVSLVLAWVSCIPIILTIIIYPIVLLFEKQEGLPRIFTIWLVLCFIFFSPLRYILLQVIVATAYPFQSFHALTTILVLIYIPIVFSILYAVGIGLPFLSLGAIAGFKDPISKFRLFFSAILAPFVLLIFSYLFYFILPYATYSTHWLSAKDVIRATNGPAEYYFRYLAEPATPMEFGSFAMEIGLENMSSKEVLRAHIATLYLGKKELAYYIYKAYPNYYENKLKQSK